jgi:hypothetical protein
LYEFARDLYYMERDKINEATLACARQEPYK